MPRVERRHLDALMNRLEDAKLNRCTHITWNELYHWYGVRRLAAGTWRDIREKWEEIAESDDGGLLVVEGRGGVFLLPKKRVKPLAEWEGA